MGASILSASMTLAACGGSQSTDSGDEAVSDAVTEMIAANMVPFTDFEIETEDGVDGSVWYEVELDTELEIYFTEDGAIPKFEARIPFSMLPKAVLSMAMETAGEGAEMYAAELVLFGDLMVYEVEFNEGQDDELDVYVEADGTLYDEYGAADEAAVEEGDSNAMVEQFAEMMVPMTDYTVEMEAGRDGATWYEVEYVNEVEVYFTESGEMPKYEAHVPFALVPEAAMQAAMEAAPEGTEAVQAEFVILMGEQMWEIEFAAPGSDEDTDIYVNSDGTMVREY